MIAPTRVRAIAARLVERRWDWAEAKADAIAAHFERRRVARPAIFNGRILLASAMRRRADTLEVEFFAADYASLLAHLDWEDRDPAVTNGFAMGALRGADGGYILGEMAAHTANGGKCYFPAGTPDLGDVRPDGSVDLAGSIRREILEETGLDLAADALAPGWTIVDWGPYAAFFREVVLAEDAETIRGQIEAHIARTPEPELAAIRILRRPDEIASSGVPGYLAAYLRDRMAQR